MHCTLPLQETAALLLLSLLAAAAAAVGPVVRCEPCDARALEQCKPLAAECAELAREPGCGCCLTCALREGSSCGVYSERCGAGLNCLPRPGEPRPLQALLEGRGVCANASGGSRHHHQHQLGPHAAGNSSDSEEDRNVSSAEKQEVTGTHRVLSHNPHRGKISIITKVQAKNNQRYKLDYNQQNTDTLNFSSESKQETEYGPCRREMESILNHLKITNILSPTTLHIPNCDKKGFYKKKQCRPSKGRKRGSCWCVDKYGQPLPGFDGKSKGDVHCYNMENK
ncbi:insulin-like growth factor-binding protein 3 [Rhinatrema bivittatum]|uniref:insulin-like growth factor-binding protein 3 n=1 Tax=Rhinatrema bivittatum TaxID=194408 RepID=UPI001128E72F|nr:insulin-like growth factor-binding protein 3 [Rhinatrema bivittatum]